MMDGAIPQPAHARAQAVSAVVDVVLMVRLSLDFCRLGEVDIVFPLRVVTRCPCSQSEDDGSSDLSHQSHQSHQSFQSHQGRRSSEGGVRDPGSGSGRRRGDRAQQQQEVPPLHEITAYYRDLFNRTKLKFVCIVLSLIYVERLMKVRGFVRCWRRFRFPESPGLGCGRFRVLNLYRRLHLPVSPGNAGSPSPEAIKLEVAVDVGAGAVFEGKQGYTLMIG